jgi:serine/threonine protein kinase
VRPNAETGIGQLRSVDFTDARSDYIEGANLSDWLSARRLPTRDVAELSTKFARSLHHAHEQGVVHRDLKPSNIMIDLDGDPHIFKYWTRLPEHRWKTRVLRYADRARRALDVFFDARTATLIERSLAVLHGTTIPAAMDN